MDLDDFFDRSNGPIRDKNDRPMLIPRGGTTDDRQWYTRASGLGEFIEDNSFLIQWEQRYLAIGYSRRMDLVRLAAAETYTTGFDKGDNKENSASGRRIDALNRRALEAAKIHEKADYGTAVHARTEPGNQGVDPDEMQANDVSSFWALIKSHGITILDTEFFMANDKLRSAGTCDHLLYVPRYGIIIGDKKTSSKASKTYDVQFSVYANAEYYDYTTDQRMTLEERVEQLGWDPSLINRDVGVILWVKNGRTQLRYLDLKEGLVAAEHAAWVRDVHQTKGVAKDVTKEIAETVAELRMNLMGEIQHARSIDFLDLIWENRENQSVWTDEHTAAAKARKAELA